MTSITRRYRFSASHRLHSPQLSAAENARLYGKCNNPFGHGHDYTLEVSVSGEIDRDTGVIVPVPRLDRLVEREILDRFAFRNINDLPEFADLVASTENIALVVARILQLNWNAYLGDARAQFRRIHIQETPRNSFEVFLPARPDASVNNLSTESVPVYV